MAFSCLLTRTVSAGQCFLRGQPLRTASIRLLRSSAVLTNVDSNKRNQFLQNETKFLSQKHLLPATLSNVKFYSSEVEPSYKKHNHVMVWAMERIVSFGILGAIPVAMACQSQIVDVILSAMFILHVHWGLEAIVVDYIRPKLFGNLAPKIGLALLYLFSMGTLAGLLNLIYNDSGLMNTIIAIIKTPSVCK